MKEKKNKHQIKESQEKEIKPSVGGHVSGASAQVGSSPDSFLDVEDYPL